MKERGISFSTELMPRVLDGSKTQTRRTRGLDKINENPNAWMCYQSVDGRWVFHRAEEYYELLCWYGVPGDRLWIKESWCVGLPALPLTGEGIRPILGKLTPELGADLMKRAYRATWDGADQPPWRSGRFMPKWAARSERLEIVRVWPERLQSISEADAKAEGVPLAIASEDGDGNYYDSFIRVWDYLNGERYPSESNPWVWVIEWLPVQS